MLLNVLFRRRCIIIFNTLDKSNIKYILNLALLAIAMVALTIKFVPDITTLIKDPKDFHQFISSYKSLGVLVFIAFQVLQVVIAAIPGEFVQIAGGYIFGTFLGAFYSVVGILIGAGIAFFTTRLFGQKAVNKILTEQSFAKLEFLMNSHKAEIILFFLFLIPGIPKDILVYVAGLCPIRPLRFFSIYTVARMPGLLGASIIGANLQNQNYILSASFFIISCLLFLGGMLGRKAIFKKLKSY